MERTIDRTPPTEEDINRAFEYSKIVPLRTELGAVCDHMFAISLLNRYCMSLPKDQFTVSAVSWRKETNKYGQIACHVMLPIQSPIREEIRVSA